MNADYNITFKRNGENEQSLPLTDVMATIISDNSELLTSDELGFTGGNIDAYKYIPNIAKLDDTTSSLKIDFKNVWGNREFDETEDRYTFKNYVQVADKSSCPLPEHLESNNCSNKVKLTEILLSQAVSVLSYDFSSELFTKALIDDIRILYDKSTKSLNINFAYRSFNDQHEYESRIETVTIAERASPNILLEIQAPGGPRPNDDLKVGSGGGAYALFAIDLSKDDNGWVIDLDHYNNVRIESSYLSDIGIVYLSKNTLKNDSIFIPGDPFLNGVNDAYAKIECGSCDGVGIYSDDPDSHEGYFRPGGFCYIINQDIHPDITCIAAVNGADGLSGNKAYSGSLRNPCKSYFDFTHVDFGENSKLDKLKLPHNGDSRLGPGRFPYNLSSDVYYAPAFLGRGIVGNENSILGSNAVSVRDSIVTDPDIIGYGGGGQGLGVVNLYFEYLTR